MPLVVWAYLCYLVGLFAGFQRWFGVAGAVAAGAVIVCVGIAASLLSRRSTPLALALIMAAALTLARSSPAPPRFPGRATDSFAGVRERVGLKIDRIFQGDAPLARALLIADQREIPIAVRDRYAASGLVHMLSISGLHVAIIASGIELLLVALRIGRRMAALATVAVVSGYVLMLGCPPPALRSAVMLGVAAVSRGIERPSSPWAALAVGAWIPIVSPRVALDLGYQLSVAGMVALTAAGIFAHRSFPRGWSPLRARMSRELLASVLASAATAPLVAWHFGRLSLVGPVANLLAGPVMAVLQPTLFLALVLARVDKLATFIADAAHPLAYAFDAVARAAASVPAGEMLLAPTFAVTLCFTAVSAGLLAAAAARHPGRPLLIAAGAVAVFVWIPSLPVHPVGTVELHMLDVGQGDALALRTDRGNWVIFDAGRAWRGGDAGRSTLIPHVRRRGGDVLALVISHPHADHIGGAASVIKWLRPRTVWDPAFVFGAAPYAATLAAAGAAPVEWRRAKSGDSLRTDGVKIVFLAPDSAWAASLADPNSASVVALVEYGAVRFLLTGDAELEEELWLIEHALPRLDIDVLKVAHHGSNTSSSEPFLDATTPSVALISVGAQNKYRHPSPVVVRRLARRRVPVLRTDRDGTVVVRTDGARITVGTGGDEWELRPGSLPR